LPLEGIQDLLLGVSRLPHRFHRLLRKDPASTLLQFSTHTKIGGRHPDAVADSSLLFEKANAGNLLPSRSSERPSVLRDPPAAGSSLISLD
jgi:hypothetical protein